MRLPKAIAKESNLREGSTVSFSTRGNDVMLHQQKKPHYTLDELLKDFDKKTQHELIDWGPDVGNEILPPWQE